MERLKNNYDYENLEMEKKQKLLNDITLDTSRLSCFASLTDDEADKVSEYDSDLSEILFSLADAIKVYANMIDDKVRKIYNVISSEANNPKNNHNE